MNQFSLFAPSAPSIDGICPRKGYASYSGDRIPEGKVRTPVFCNGDLWVCVGAGGAGAFTLNFYRLIPPSEFTGETYTYNEKTRIWRESDTYPGDFARNDPNGFYDGMTVKSGAKSYVMAGPELSLETTWELARTPYVAGVDEDEEDAQLPLGAEDEDEDGDEDGLDEALGDGECLGCAKPDEMGDHYYAAPCGSFCEDCMAAHVASCSICASEFAGEFVYDDGPPALPPPSNLDLFPVPVTLSLF